MGSCASESQSSYSSEFEGPATPPSQNGSDGSADSFAMDSMSKAIAAIRSNFNDQTEIGLINTRQTFSFKMSELKVRGCRGLLELIKQKEGAPIILGEDTTMKAHPIYTDTSSSAAMKLFEEWVHTGKLRPLVKRHSSPIRTYYVLYMIAYNLAHATLCNHALNEILGWTIETRQAPRIDLTPQLVRALGEDMPKQLERAIAFYRISGCSSNTEDRDCEGDWEDCD